MLKNAKDIGYKEYKNILIYGAPFIGKTVNTLLTCAKPALLIDIDNSQDAYSPFIKDCTDIDVYLPDKKIQYELDEILKLSGKYRTVIFDTINILQKDMMSKDLTSNPINKFKYDEWGIVLRMLRSIIFKLNAIKCNKIYICTDKQLKDEKGITCIYPDIDGSIYNDIYQLFDNIWYLYLYNNKRYVATQDGNLLNNAYVKLLTKNRSGINTNVEYNLSLLLNPEV